MTPPPEVARLVTAPRQQNATLAQQSPDRRYFLAMHSDGLGNNERFARAHVYLGGVQVDTRANRSRPFTTRGLGAIEIVDALTGARTRLEIPAGATTPNQTRTS